MYHSLDFNKFSQFNSGTIGLFYFILLFFHFLWMNKFWLGKVELKKKKKKSNIIQVYEKRNIIWTWKKLLLSNPKL